MNAQTTTDDSIVFSAIARVDTLQSFLDPMLTIADEAVINAGVDGFRSTTPDPANVAMAEPKLYPDAFESFDPQEGAQLGVNLERLDDLLGVGSSDDLVHLELDAETRRLEIRVGDSYEFDLALIDPNTIASFDQDPSAEFKTVVGLEGSDFSQAVKAASMSSDHVAFRGDPDDDALVLAAEGDTDRSRVTFGPDDRVGIDDAEIARCESLFSLDYLDDFRKAIGSNAEAVVRVGDDVPLFVDFEIAEGDGEAQFMLAPRLTKDD